MELPFGMWKSKIEPEFVAERGRISDVRWDKSSGALLFSGSKAGKSFLYIKYPGTASRLINEQFPIGGCIGYGGGDFSTADGKVVFCSHGNGICLRGSDRSSIKTITFDKLDTASPIISPDGKCAAYISSDGTHDQIMRINLAEYDWPIRWISGADFYMQPVWSSDGKYFAWAEWNHPNMPWQGSRIMLAEIEPDSKKIRSIRQITDGVSAPASQPLFSPDNQWLSFIRSNGEWQDLVAISLQNDEEKVMVRGNDFDLSVPPFSQGMHSYDWLSDSQHIYFVKIHGTQANLFLLNLSDNSEKQILLPGITSIAQVSSDVLTGSAAFIGSGPTIPACVITAGSDGALETIYCVGDLNLPEEWISLPEEISWNAPDGTEVHGLWYAPKNPDYHWNGLPPAIVHIHGGPTGKAERTFSAETAYFTSRGYGYAEVNYRGSHGWGTSYMNRLNGHWGEYDTQDAVGCADFLGSSGRADRKRMLITGGSSGGYAVLNVMTQYPEAFTAGACLYGVSDLYGLASGTHKLESHYNDSLIGTLPEADELYRRWSPIYHVSQITRPLAVFQGDSDPVVPPEQATMLVSQLSAPHIFKMYTGEGHGFHKPETIIDYLQSMSTFCRMYL